MNSAIVYVYLGQDVCVCCNLIYIYISYIYIDDVDLLLTRDTSFQLEMGKE